MTLTSVVTLTLFPGALLSLLHWSKMLGEGLETIYRYGMGMFDPSSITWVYSY